MNNFKVKKDQAGYSVYQDDQPIVQGLSAYEAMDIARLLNEKNQLAVASASRNASSKLSPNRASTTPFTVSMKSKRGSKRT